MKKENVKVKAKAKATKSTKLFKNSFVTFGKVQKAAWQYKKPRGNCNPNILIFVFF